MADNLINIDDSLARLQSITERNKIIRDKVIDKLTSVVDTLNLNHTEAKTLSAQTELILALNSYLESSSKDSALLTKNIMAKKTTELETNFAQQAVAILRDIRGIEILKSPVMTETELNNADAILDGLSSKEISDNEIKI